jgi:hypothetical protein
MTNLEILQRLKTAFFTDEEGEPYTIEFEPGLSDQQLAGLDTLFPAGKVPAELREILKETRGWQVEPFEATYLDAIDESGYEELIPHSVTLDRDGAGNFWLWEMKSNGTCGKIFFACHDPAVLVIYCDTINEYLLSLEEYYSGEEETSYIEVQEKTVMEVWEADRNVHEIASFRLDNPSYASILSEYDENWVIADLRNAKNKDGFAWGKYGPGEFFKRLGDDLVWVMQKKKKGFFGKLFGK